VQVIDDRLKPLADPFNSDEWRAKLEEMVQHHLNVIERFKWRMGLSLQRKVTEYPEVFAKDDLAHHRTVFS
jgi:hypothetical protein